jgi:hypothetical protein
MGKSKPKSKAAAERDRLIGRIEGVQKRSTKRDDMRDRRMGDVIKDDDPGGRDMHSFTHRKNYEVPKD